VHISLLIGKKPVDALIEALSELLPFLNRLLSSYLIEEEIDFGCAVSQRRKDVEGGRMLKELWFPKPEKVRLRGVRRDSMLTELGKKLIGRGY